MSLINQTQYDEISSWFQSGGRLMQLGCTPRPSQQMMVDYVTTALDEEKSLLCEAPTGVGKTYSYLFPLAAIVSDSKRTTKPMALVVSTSTKGLQRQLKAKDFPAVGNIFPNLKHHVWMGASNYICGVRLKKAATKHKLDHEVRAEIDYLNSVFNQIKALEHGWREELPIPVSDKTWEEICGETKPCCQATATKTGDAFCHKRRAFMKATQSDILCVNHSLLCNLALHTESIHPGIKDPERLFLVIDEAHDLEENLRRCLNQNFNIGQLRKNTRKITNAELEVKMQEELSEIRRDLLDLTPEEPTLIEASSDTLCQPLTALSKYMQRLALEILDDTEHAKKAGTSLNEEDLKEVQAIVTGLNNNSQVLQGFVEDPHSGAMLEISKPTFSKNPEPSIQFCPFTLDKELDMLWKLSKLQILTSATLFNATEEGTKEQYRLTDANSIVIPPNFEYGKIIKAYAVQIDSKKALDTTELVKWLKPAIEMSAGHSLVLFTSYKAMNDAYGTMRDWATTKGFNLIVQSKATPPAQLIETMTKVKNTVIFGTNTLWTGVDIKGSNLSSVIITKLPFKMPDNYVKCYSKYLEEKKINAFYSWSVPDMVNKTRQGIGRLIRDETDRGLLFMLDPRFLSTKYGQTARNRIYIDEHGKTTVDWIKVSDPRDLIQDASTKKWLGVSDPFYQTKQIVDTYEEMADDNVPF